MKPNQKKTAPKQKSQPTKTAGKSAAVQLQENFAKEVWKGSALLAPVPPTLVSVGFEGVQNLLTVAWTGMACTNPPVLTIAVRKSRFSYDLMVKSGCFVVNLPTVELLRAVDFCGVRSGKTVNKWEECSLTPMAADTVEAPLVGECPLSLECKIRSVTELGTHDLFVADVTAVQVAKRLLDNKGRLCLERANLLAYAHGGYYGLGKLLGTFGYSVRKQK